MSITPVLQQTSSRREATYPTPEGLVLSQRVQEVIAKRKLEGSLLVGNAHLDLLNCSIRLERLDKRSLVTRCGHTFSSAIYELIGKGCPQCRRKIDSLVLNQPLNRLIEELEGPLFTKLEEPLFTSRKKNQPRADSYLKIAELSVAQGDYEKAIKAYENVLMYSGAWESYSRVPALYKQLGKEEEAAFSALYLSVYQLQAGKTLEAVESLRRCRKDFPELDLDAFIAQSVKRELATGEASREVIELAMDLVFTEKEEREVVATLRQVIACDPSYLPAYERLIPLLREKDWEERVSLSRQAADVARTLEWSGLERYFLQEAARQPPPQWISQEEWAHPNIEALKRLCPYPRALQQFLEGDCTIWRERKRSATHIVVPLFPKVISGEEVQARTLATLDTFDKASGGLGYEHIGNKIPRDVPADEEFRWAVMTANVLPGSTRAVGLLDPAQRVPQGYEVPRLLDVATAILWSRRSSGGVIPNFFTRCRERDPQHSYYMVGSRSRDSGLLIASDFYHDIHPGQVAWRTF